MSRCVLGEFPSYSLITRALSTGLCLKEWTLVPEYLEENLASTSLLKIYQMFLDTLRPLIALFAKRRIIEVCCDVNV